MAERWADLPLRLEALAGVLRDAGADHLVLRDPATLAWLLEARVHVPQTLDTACLDAVVSLGDAAPELSVVTNAIEAPRLRDTELADLPAHWEVVPWWESRDRRLPTGAGTVTDRPSAGERSVSAEVTAVRRILSPRQEALLADVCRDAAAAASRACARLSPGTTEYGAAGVLAQELLDGGMDPVVLMAAGGDRSGRHRHPLPTNQLVGQRAMLVCCARRSGLVASVTRFVSFQPLTAAEQDAYRRLLEVESVFLDATGPGTRLGDVVEVGAAAYASHGFAPDEWHRHHQGGLTGFQPREFPAHGGSDLVLDAGMAVAWNPSADGWKVEDTAVVTANGPRLLVHDPDWPALTVGGRTRPGVLTR